MVDTNPKVTIYNGGFGVVRLVKEIDCPNKGVNAPRIEDIASQIDTTSVRIKGIDSDIAVLEQNYKYDLVNLEKLMQRCVGEEIKANYTVGSEDKLIEGKLLSYFGNQVLIETGNEGEKEIEVFQASKLNLRGIVGKDLVLKPTLEWLIATDKPGKQNVELSYITNGMKWEADYVAVLAADSDDKMDLQGWVDIVNNSGQKFEDANLKLIAGDVRRETNQYAGRGRQMKAMAMSLDAEAAGFEEEQLFDYHMYELQRPATIADKEQKQIGLMKAEDIDADKRYVFNGNKVGIYMGFRNSKENNLGDPLPAGRIRFFKPDSSGTLQYIGESRIDHTTKNEDVKDLYLGNAFDIAVDTRITHQNRMANVHDSEVEYKVKNRKDEDITLEIPVHMGANRTMELRGDVSDVNVVEDSALMYTVHATVKPDAEKIVRVYTRHVQR